MGEAGEGITVAHVIEVELRLVETEVHLTAHQTLGFALERDLGIAAAGSCDKKQQADDKLCNPLRLHFLFVLLALNVFSRRIYARARAYARI